LLKLKSKSLIYRSQQFSNHYILWACFLNGNKFFSQEIANTSRNYKGFMSLWWHFFEWRYLTAETNCFNHLIANTWSILAFVLFRLVKNSSKSLPLINFNYYIIWKIALFTSQYSKTIQTWLFSIKNP
jgi:hypothetical protein